jgi:integrase
LTGQAFANFQNAIRSPATQDPYERRLVYFLEWYGTDCQTFIDHAKKDPLACEEKVMQFIVHEKARMKTEKIAPSTVTNSLKAVRLLLDMNRIVLNWKLMRRMLPRMRRYALDRSPTLQEIRAMVDKADIRGKAMTLTFVSSGIREGAIETLKVGHVTPIKQDGKVVCAKIIVYPGDEEQYITFVTAEAYEAIASYLEFRKRSGEKVVPESPLFRDKFDPIANIKHRKIRNTHVHEPKPWGCGPLRKYYNDLFYALGYRTGPKRRHEFSIHGFRKYFKTTAERAGMKPIDVETLMGHSTGISDSYYRPTEHDLMQSYLAIAPQLSVSEIEEVKRTVAVQEHKNSDKIQRLEALVEQLIAEKATANL